MDRFDATPAIRPDRAQQYRAPDRLPTDHLAYSGTATVQEEHVEAGRDFAIDLAFRGRQVFLVLGGNGTTRRGQVLLDGRPIPADLAGDDVSRDGSLVVREHRLYRLVDLGRPGTGRLTIRLAPGTKAYAFTFG
jgi:hypothetical protein